MLLQSIQDKEGKISSLYDSSNVLASKYDPISKKLVIIFSNGGQYLYDNVPESVFLNFQKSDSQGKMIHSIIKSFSGKKVSVVDVSTILEDIQNLKKHK